MGRGLRRLSAVLHFNSARGTAMNLVLTSERLLLRPLAETDLDLALETFGDPVVMRCVTKT